VRAASVNFKVSDVLFHAEMLRISNSSGEGQTRNTSPKQHCFVILAPQSFILKRSRFADLLTRRNSRKPVAMQATSTRLPRGRAFVQGVPPALRPVLRAYVLGYASSTAPRLLTLLLTHLSRKRKNIDEKPDDFFLLSLFRILKGGLELQRFPTFCAALVGGSTLLQARDQTAFYTPANKRVRYPYADYSHV
jgi:hypothetical protein